MLDEDDDPDLEDHWLTREELEIKKKNILEATLPPTHVRDRPIEGSQKPRSPFLGPLPHDEPFLSESESPGDAQDLRLDEGYHGKSTAPKEVNEVVRGDNSDVRQSAYE